MREYKDFLKSQESTDSSWDFMSWLTTGNWSQVLLKIVMPSIVILFLFCLLVPCIVSCTKQMMTKMITDTMVQYSLLQLKEGHEEEDVV